MAKTLTLIQNEIRRLQERSDNSPTGLNIEDVKKLEILVRTGQYLVATPSIEASREKNSASDLSDEELDAAEANLKKDDDEGG